MNVYSIILYRLMTVPIAIDQHKIFYFTTGISVGFLWLAAAVDIFFLKTASSTPDEKAIDGNQPM